MKDCPICNSKKTNAILRSQKEFISQIEFDIRKCSDCEIAYTDPCPENLDPYYPSNYRGYNSLIKGLLKAFYRARINGWTRNFNTPGKVLEIGCGPGYMLDVFRKKGWDVVGLERSEGTAKHAKEVLGLDVRVGDLNLIPDEREFDLIVIFNVLEHVTEPMSILRGCSKRLKTNGQLIINVPNLDSWQAKFAGPHWLHLDPPRHLFHFTPKSIESALSKAGLKMNEVRYNSFEFDSFGWLQSSLNKITGHYNVFALYLMGIKPLSILVLLSYALSCFLTVPSIIITIIGAINKKGALMQVRAHAT